MEIWTSIHLEYMSNCKVVEYNKKFTEDQTGLLLYEDQTLPLSLSSSAPLL